MKKRCLRCLIGLVGLGLIGGCLEETTFEKVVNATFAREEIVILGYPGDIPDLSTRAQPRYDDIPRERVMHRNFKKARPFDSILRPNP